METDNPSPSKNAENVQGILNKEIECEIQYPMWIGRRKLRRKITQNYKNCTMLDIENQISNQLLVTAEKFKEIYLINLHSNFHKKFP